MTALSEALSRLGALVAAAEARRADPSVAEAMRAALRDLEYLAARLRAACEAEERGTVALGITRVWKAHGTRKAATQAHKRMPTVVWKADGVVEFYPEGDDGLTIPTVPANATGPTG